MAKSSTDLPWVEKYRPQHLSEIVSHEETIQSLTHFIGKGAIPHLLFAGPAGTGKTSTALALIHDFLGADFSPANVLEMNASDTVRMDDVRTTLKQFIGQESLLNDRLKFIVLDEADNIPKVTQPALRRMIEVGSRTVRFIFLCNYPEAIIDPIRSRCAVFRFSPLPRDLVIAQLNALLAREAIDVDAEIVEYIYKISRGDLRGAINLLQMAVTFQEATLTGAIELKTLLEIAGYLSDRLVAKVFQYLREQPLARCRALFRHVLRRVTPRNFFFQLLDAVPGEGIAGAQLAEFLRVVGRYDFRLTQESGNRLQHDALLADLVGVFRPGGGARQARIGHPRDAGGAP